MYNGWDEDFFYRGPTVLVTQKPFMSSIDHPVSSNNFYLKLAMLLDSAQRPEGEQGGNVLAESRSFKNASARDNVCGEFPICSWQATRTTSTIKIDPNKKKRAVVSGRINVGMLITATARRDLASNITSALSVPLRKVAIAVIRCKPFLPDYPELNG